MPRHPDLDELTEGLVPAVDKLGRRVARLIDVSKREQPLVCPFCLENAGWCTYTGGPNPCEGHVDQAALLVDTADAPELTIHTGGA